MYLPGQMLFDANTSTAAALAMASVARMPRAMLLNSRAPMALAIMRCLLHGIFGRGAGRWR